jgi:hypothetical protein
MNQQNAARLEVTIDRSATPEDEETVEAIFEDFGVHVAMRTSMPTTDVQLLWELVICAAPLGGAFLAAIGKNAGDDVYRQAKQLISRLWQSRNQHTKHNGHIVLRDDDFHAQLRLRENLPTDAYQAIERIDRTKIQRGDTLHYDAAANAWVPYLRGSLAWL